MKRIIRILSTTLGLLFIGALAYFGWGALSLFVEALKDADAAVTASIIGGIATISVGLAVTLYTQTQIKQREVDEAHRPRKIEIYEGFLRIAQRMLAAANDNVKGEPVPEKELLDFMVGFKTDLIFWSSPGVINAFRAFERISASNSGPHTVLPAVDRIYREMRKDIGLSNRGLPSNQLIKMYLNDAEELDEMLSKAGL